MNIISDRVYSAQLETESFGKLQVVVVTQVGARPIENATVRISYSGDPTSTVQELTTDISGRTAPIELPTPPLENSLVPLSDQPYSEYTIIVTAPGYEKVEISGDQILPDVTAIQQVEMVPSIEATGNAELFVISPHTLYGDYPPKIAEAEIKPTAESGEIVLSRVVIPEFIIVHDGPPTDTSAKNHYVRYRDYIKNVASSEIYATWPQASLYANILAIMSFTLNRVYTEWYRNQGYPFTITSSTAFDHKWMPGRNIYDNISLAVDTIFNSYLSRPNVKQPILTQYCDGQRVTCPNWMSQWGSKTLADQGLQPIEILRNYYGNSIYINTANEVAGVPASWPGANLTNGSSGENVRQMQDQLNTVANVYTLIPKVAVDGQFGPATAAAVKAFQEIFGLPANGIVDLPTWYKISELYVAVSRIAE